MRIGGQFGPFAPTDENQLFLGLAAAVLLAAGGSVLPKRAQPPQIISVQAPPIRRGRRLPHPAHPGGRRPRRDHAAVAEELDDADRRQRHHFRPHRLGFFLALAIVLRVGLASLTLDLSPHPAWLAGSALIVYQGGALVSHYAAGSLAPRGYDLVLIQGTFVAREVTLPIWEARIAIRQTLIGRALDAGMVIVQVGEERVHCHVAQLRALRRLVAERKLQLLALAERRTLVLAKQPSWVIADELVGPPSPTWPSLGALGGTELPQRGALRSIRER
ncbi:MAG: hypothetical protein HGA45_29495 [Chloroflexales bacterium]|nr:hypothetical protein [Chloroflexales bacterium]